MEKIKNILKNNKKIVIIGGTVLVLLLIVIALVVGNNNKKEKEISLDDSLSNFGSRFYKEHYYKQIKNKNDLKNHKDNGLTLSITNLEVIIPLDKETKKLFDDKNCDYDDSKIMIYPEAPYGEENYKIKVELTCKK